MQRIRRDRGSVRRPQKQESHALEFGDPSVAFPDSSFRAIPRQRRNAVANESEASDALATIRQISVADGGA